MKKSLMTTFAVFAIAFSAFAALTVANAGYMFPPAQGSAQGGSSG